MTEQNRTNDPIPENENLGSAGSPHSTGRAVHRYSTAFEDSEAGLSPSHCSVCGAAISPTQDRCSDHKRADNTEGNSKEPTWRISNIALAVVPASNKYQALANAAVAFERRDHNNGLNESYDLIYDFSEPADILTSGWGGTLPDAAKLDSPLGEDLLTKAREKSAWSSNSAASDERLPLNAEAPHSSDNNETKYIFTERGTTVSSKEELSTFHDGPDDQKYDYWIVPALLYKQAQNTTDTAIRTRRCPSCGITQHLLEQAEAGKLSPKHSSDGIWSCLECGHEKRGPTPQSSKQQNPTQTPESSVDYISKAQREQFERIMNQLDSEGRI
jgi:ribosomal protein L37AE/L43A